MGKCITDSESQLWDYEKETSHVVNRVTKLCLDPMRFDKAVYPDVGGLPLWCRRCVNSRPTACMHAAFALEPGLVTDFGCTDDTDTNPLHACFWRVALGGAILFEYATGFPKERVAGHNAALWEERAPEGRDHSDRRRVFREGPANPWMLASSFFLSMWS